MGLKTHSETIFH